MRRLLLFVALLAPPLCPAQVTGAFSLEKSTFAVGEPVFLSFTLHNEGKEMEEVSSADPYSFCSGNTIHITRDAARQPACFRVFGGSCMSGATSLAPGASRTERLLLNYRNDSKGDLSAPVRVPGDYTVDASGGIAYATPGASQVFTAPNHSEAHQVFHLHVDDALELSPTVYAPYVQQLTSKDDQLRREAARTLATLAPPALEPLLLTFANSKDRELREFAPLALANLATKASLAALAQMLLNSAPGTYEFMTAADDLGKTHDPAWFPLLMEIAYQHGDMYLSYAAESGGDAAIPAMLARLHSPDSETRGAAIYALGQTGSRAAVPLLISLIGTEASQRDAAGMNVSLSANQALRQLTHFYAEQGSDDTLVPSWHRRWQQWWLAAGASAPIYRPGDCVADTPLP
jgi:HEAT repeats